MGEDDAYAAKPGSTGSEARSGSNGNAGAASGGEMRRTDADARPAVSGRSEVSGSVAGTARPTSVPEPKWHSMTRRTVLAALGATALLCGLGALRYVGSTAAVRPPGGADEDRLFSKCIRCQRCYEACPQHVIVPSGIEGGVMGVHAPRLAFDNCDPGDVEQVRYCTFCADDPRGPKCVQVCPSSALELSGQAFDTMALGRARIDHNLCMAWRNATCQFCYDACVKARGKDAVAIVLLGDRENGLRPEVDADRCNGCGACEAACVSAQSGSVVSTDVRAAHVHPIDELEG